MKLVSIIDYGCGNIRSVFNALNAIREKKNIKVLVTREEKEIKKAPVPKKVKRKIKEEEPKVEKELVEEIKEEEPEVEEEVVEEIKEEEPEVEEEVVEEIKEEEPEVKEEVVKDEDSIKKGLEKTKKSFFSKLKSAIIGKSKIDDEVLDDLEEVLITSDVGVETTVNFPMKTSHGLLSQDERDNQGIGNKLIRLSVGIESYKDLFNDLDQAIKNSLI